MPLTAEMTLLIRSMRLRSSRSEADLSSHRESLNWNHLLWLGRQHRALLFLHDLVKKSGAEINPPVPAQLDSLDQANRLRSMSRGREICLLHDIFENAGIPTVLISGWVLGYRYYDEPELREVGETIGYFVHPKNRAHIEAVLREARYSLESDALKLTQRERSHVLLYTGIGTEGISPDVSIEITWRNVETISVGGRRIQTLTPAGWILHLCWRGGMNLWSDLRRMFDLACVLRRNPALDWTTVLDQAAQLRLDKAVLLGMSICARVMGLQLPELVARRLERRPAILRHSKTLALRLHSDAANPPGLLALACARTSLQPDLPQKLSCIWRHLQIARRSQLAPKRSSKGEIAYIGRYAPTPEIVVTRMLRLAEAAPGDVVCDPGCGDGRVVIAAAKSFGARGIGIDIDPQRITEANAAANMAGVAGKVTFICDDLLKADFSAVSVVCLYLQGFAYPAIRKKLQRELKPGARIVSHDFSFPGWPPDRAEIIRTAPIRISHIYLWRL